MRVSFPATKRFGPVLAGAFCAVATLAVPAGAGERAGALLGLATLPIGTMAGAGLRPEGLAADPVSLDLPGGEGLAAALGLRTGAGASGLPRVFAPAQPRERHTRYPWRMDIVTTVFWIGERPTRNNPTPNHMSSWDMRWERNYGGYDNPAPSARDGYIPAAFTPQLNPFYIALPYNDINRSGTKASARAMIPWFNETYYRNGRTVLKGRWLAIRKGGRVCYAQWEDVGPFETDDVEYVFGDARPKTRGNRGAGLDVSPAVRDYLKFDGGYGTVDWRFVDLDEVPEGPWQKWGRNNPFATNLAGTGEPGGPVVVGDLAERLVRASLDAGPAAKQTRTHE